MGFDLYSTKHPMEDYRGYWRSSVWGWRPIALAAKLAMQHAGSPMSQAEEQGWSYNDGFVVSATRAIEVGEAIGKWLQDTRGDRAILLMREGDPWASREDYEAAREQNGGDDPEEYWWRSTPTTLDRFAQWCIDSGGFRIQ